MSKRLTRCEVQICTDPEDVDKPRCTAEIRRLRKALDIATARLKFCGEWSARCALCGFTRVRGFTWRPSAGWVCKGKCRKAAA